MESCLWQMLAPGCKCCGQSCPPKHHTGVGPKLQMCRIPKMVRHLTAWPLIRMRPRTSHTLCQFVEVGVMRFMIVRSTRLFLGGAQSCQEHLLWVSTSKNLFVLKAQLLQSLRRKYVCSFWPESSYQLCMATMRLQSVCDTLLELFCMQASRSFLMRSSSCYARFGHLTCNSVHRCRAKCNA